MANHKEYTAQEIIRSVETLGVAGTTRALQVRESDVTALVSGFVQYLKSDAGRDKIPKYTGFLQKLIQDSLATHQEEAESLQKQIQDSNVEHQRNVESMQKKIEDLNANLQESIKFMQGLRKGMGVGEQDQDAEKEMNQEHQEEVESVLKEIEDLNVEHQQNSESMQKRIQDSNARHQEYSESLQKIIEMPKYALGMRDWPDLAEHYASKEKK